MRLNAPGRFRQTTGAGGWGGAVEAKDADHRWMLAASTASNRQTTMKLAASSVEQVNVFEAGVHSRRQYRQRVRRRRALVTTVVESMPGLCNEHSEVRRKLDGPFDF